MVSSSESIPPVNDNDSDNDDTSFQESQQQQHQQQQVTNNNVISLERCGQWLLSIPSSHAVVLETTHEYRQVVHWLHKLEGTHRRMLIQGDDDYDTATPPSFLQYHTADEILHFILNFLEATSLSRLCATCTRFRALVRRHAARRAHCSLQAQQEHQHGEERQLSHPLQLVRAAEQLQGLFPDHAHVRIPTLLLRRPVVLSGAGDDDFNGIYFCTGSNGNGFVFTKPRTAVPPLHKPALRTTAQDVEVLDPTSDRRQEPAGYRLQCIISKRFSNETLLWYCCKEVLVSSVSLSNSSEEDGNEQPPPQPNEVAEMGSPLISQRYAFWARLSMLGDASDYDLCRYPSQTSVLVRQGVAGWQSLSRHGHVQPPTVELLD